MKDRIKWILVGVGFTFGIHVVISLIFTGIALSVASSGSTVGESTFPVAAYGLTLGSFLIGGFVVGWMSEELRVLDSLIVAVVAILLSALVYFLLPSGNKGQFVSGFFFTDAVNALVYIVPGLIAAAIGAYWGWHITVPQEGVVDRIALLLGLIGAIVGPFVLLALGGGDPTNPNARSLPWYFLLIVIVLVVAIV